MKSNHVTLKDIARILELSPSTVSRALKDHPDINEETKRLVKTFAEKVNYRPNALALSLRRQKTNTIGLIIPEIVHHFFSSVISGIEDLAYGEGYNVMICQSNENYQREVIDTQALIDHRVDGILVSVSKTTKDFSHLKTAHENGIPMVFFDRICEDILTDRVITDDFKGAHIATSHLIERGCRNILHLAAPQHLIIGSQRKEGYIKALQDNNIPVDEDLIVKCDTREYVASLREHLLKLIQEKKVTGIFAVNDSTAIAAMQTLQNAGYKIPDGIKVIGFGDGPNAEIACPPLTTVEQKGYETGREAMRLLLQRLENPGIEINYSTKVLTPTLKQRQST
ncbi:MAG: LacI family transcriptional regulator [Anaerophaga sp.]|uniref:LacI family DNA-binding transcriptional regulator n=1 Tax=Anaerophaga thermohalophila TaxID=177400 RepID=UPI000237C2D8|nr:LacI family DNA-binding transcriptional regulator [Anaerophaga thermohalophila]MBZ4676552.1 LacI family transcriptional regulator [Anaerophaga sp.]MDN5292137.1 LacI family transcriptional regulator [Anaerophaga sp.]